MKRIFHDKIDNPFVGEDEALVGADPVVIEGEVQLQVEAEGMARHPIEGEEVDVVDVVGRLRLVVVHALHPPPRRVDLSVLCFGI